MSLERKPQMAMLYPVPGRLIRDPETRQKLADAGELKPMSSYWLRKIKDGDVSVAAPELAQPVLEEAVPQPSKKKGKE